MDGPDGPEREDGTAGDDAADADRAGIAAGSSPGSSAGIVKL